MQRESSKLEYKGIKDKRNPKTSLKRSMMMSKIRSKDTKPEIIVRKYLWKEGFRYRLNLKRLPGHPDIVLKKYRTCIFVNGCFWHGHNCSIYKTPKTNTEFWTNKINRNIERDKEEQKQLAKMGWHCITIWECELKKDKREQTLTSLAFTLNHIFLMDHGAAEYPEVEECLNIAAEDIKY